MGGEILKQVENRRAFAQSCPMKRIWIYISIGLFAVLSGGCKPSASSPATPPSPPAYPTAAQPKLATIKLWIGPQEMIAEMAVTEKEEQTGMMFRTNMAENEGMIFVMPYPMQASFWMKNTILPLSCAYIAPDGTILEIHDLQPQDTNAVNATANNILYVLETKQGWFKRNNVGVGTVITTERGPLRKVFQQ
jgi:uncharacterized protein